VTDLHDINEKSGVVDRVYDSVVALADAVSVTLTRELFATARPRFRRKRCDLAGDSLALPLWYDSFQFLDR